MTKPDLTRRAFGGAALLGMTAPVLVACGDDEEPTGSSSAGSGGDGGSSDSPSAGGSGGDSLVAADEVPVGGGVVVKDAEVVVTQPSEGQFKCFSAICTHQGCLVAGVDGGEIRCDCHGSVFSADDGSVVNGPATQPLEEVQVAVQGGQVSRA